MPPPIRRPAPALRRAVLPTLLGLTAVRLLLAAVTGLSPDEAYYRVWAHALAPGYLDHPPMVALLIRAGTAVAGENALGVRLAAPLATLGGSLLLVRAGRDLLDLAPERAWLAALLFNATLMIGVGSVTMTPDTPVVLFWGVTLCCLGRALRTGQARWIAAAGAALGLGFCSKYTAVLLLPAIGLWLVATGPTRALLRRPATSLGVAAGLALASPVLWWNATHHWVSFVRQGGRTEVAHLGRAPRYLSELVSGQLGLLTPLIAILAVRGTVLVGRRAWRGEPGPLLVTLATAIPAAVFVVHACGDRVQANWPCVLYPSLALAAASVGAGTGPLLRRFGGALPAASLGLVLTALVYLQAALHPFAIPPRLDVTASRLDGWPGLARAVAGVDAPLRLPVASSEYGLAAELAWDGAAPVVAGVAPRWALFRLPPALAPGGTVLLVRRLGRDGAASRRDWRSLRRVAVVSRMAGDAVAERDEVLVAVPVLPLPASARLPVRSGQDRLR